VWWAIGGIVVMAAAARWIFGRNHVPDRVDRMQRALKTLHRRRPVAIAFAPDGPVVIRGRVSTTGAPLTAPMSGRACVYFHALRAVISEPVDADVDAEGASTSEGRRFQADHDRRGQPFLVTDESGTAEVAFEDVADVSFIVEQIAPPTAPGAAHMLEQLSLDSNYVPIGEVAVFVGDTVTVAGVGLHEVAPGGPSAGYRQPPGRYMVRADGEMLLMVKREEQS
jgi:hypothetical protein